MAPGSCWRPQHVLAARLMFYPPLLPVQWSWQLITTCKGLWQGCDGNHLPGVRAALPPPDLQALGAPNRTSVVGSTTWEPCKQALGVQARSIPLPHCHPLSLSLAWDFRKALVTPPSGSQGFLLHVQSFSACFLQTGVALAWSCSMPSGSRRKAVSCSGVRHLLAAPCSHAMPQQERRWAAQEQGFLLAQLRCGQGWSWPEDAREAHGTNADPAGGRHRARDQQQSWLRRVFTLLSC